MELEIKDLSLYFIVGVVFIIASWLISYVLRVVLFPLWLVALTGRALQVIMAIVIAFIILAIVTGWLVVTVAKNVAGLK